MFRRPATHFLRTILLCALLSVGAGAQPAQPKPSFVPVWTGEGSALLPQDLDMLMAQCQSQQPNPDHIVIMVHGYDNTREQSQAVFQEVAPAVAADFAKNNKRCLILGLQWDSAPPGDKVPWKAEEAYLKMVPRARSVGHLPTRQLYFRLRKHFPRAKIHMFAHSMGCEVAAACVFPEMAYTDNLPSTPASQPKNDATVGVLALAGSDLDYDVWYKTRVNFRAKNPRVQLFWMTLSKYVGDVRDHTLVVRKTSRGMAGGDAFPRMTVEQYNVVFKNKELVLDNQDIPLGHHFSKYYSQDRIDDLVQATLHLSDARVPVPPEMADIDKVMAAPNQVEPLRHWLESANFTTASYALYRLENLMCGGPKHMSDGTLEDLERLLRDTPRAVWDAQKTSKCNVAKAGYWPSQRQMEAAGAPAWAKPE